MPQSEYRARQVRAKTHEVYEYDHDETKPGKPLHVLIPGGLIALAALALIVFIGYLTWFEESLGERTALPLIGILAPFYVGGVFLFSYGYELYNLPRALRLTAIIVFVTVAAVVIVAVLLFVLANTKGGSRSSSRSSSRSLSKSSSGSPKSADVFAQKKSGLGGGVIGGAAAKKTASSSPGRNSSGGDIFVLDGGGRTRVETREVTKKVVKEVPKEPMPITCPFCSRSYVPIQHNYICPSCGAATPKDLIEESQMPGE